jgi:hypothetical protein
MFMLRGQGAPNVPPVRVSRPLAASTAKQAMEFALRSEA